MPETSKPRSDLPASDQPLLTIAIPTWNRAAYLAQGLAQLKSELRAIPPGRVEILVSDNCSPDDTPGVVRRAIEGGLPIEYIRNESNVGWALNFAQAYDRSRGKYVLLFGDDDLFVDGALGLLIDRISRNEYGAVVLRPYGFDNDFRAENPGAGGSERVFRDPNQFLIATSRWFTLTSACVLNKSLIAGVNSREFIKSDLATFHLFLRAVLAGRQSLFFQRYLIASKRQNSPSYDYAKVFVGDLWQIIDAHVAFGLSPATVRRLERDKLLSYYPFYLYDLRTSGSGDPARALQQFARRFSDRWLFRVWLAPILTLPKPLGVAWGGLTTVVGRVIAGDLRRGIKFAWHRLTRVLTVPRTAPSTQP